MLLTLYSLLHTNNNTMNQKNTAPTNDSAKRIEDNKKAMNEISAVIGERLTEYLNTMNADNSSVHLHTAPTKAEIEGAIDKIAIEISALYGSQPFKDRNMVQNILFHFGKVHTLPVGFVGYFLSKIPGVNHISMGMNSGYCVGNRAGAKVTNAVKTRSIKSYEELKDFFTESDVANETPSVPASQGGPALANV